MVLLLLAVIWPLQEPESTPSEAEFVFAARHFFEEARDISEQDSGDLWGISLDGPMMLVDAPRRRIFTNRQVPEAPPLRDAGGVFIGDQPRLVFAANAAQQWGGLRWTTIVFQALPRGNYRRRTILAHEMFHRIQPDLGLRSPTPANGHLDTEKGRYWIRLELRALSEALLQTGDEREIAIEDALLFRARRQSLFEGSAESERLLELNEGLAQYTGLRLSGLPYHNLASWTARRLADDESAEGSDPIWMMRRMSGEESTASLVRVFAYLTGPAYGLLLDAHAPDWRGSIDASTDITELMRQTLGLERSEPSAEELSNREEAYQAWIVALDESRRQEKREAEQAKFRALLVDEPVFILPLSGRKQLRFKTPEIVTLQGVGRVYKTLKAISAWGSLDVHSVGALSHFDESGNPADIVVPIPVDVNARPLRGEGWTLELEDGWEIVPGPRDGDLLLQKVR